MMAGIPDYAAAPLERYLDFDRQTYRLLFLSTNGIAYYLQLPAIHKWLTKVADHFGEPTDENTEKKLKEAQNIAEFVKKEIDRDFPITHAQALVGLWGALESCIEDVVVAILTNEPALLQSEQFLKVKVPLSQYESLDGEERMRLVVLEIERSQDLFRRDGLEHFESVLGTINLNGDIPTHMRKTMKEICHTRNVIVHRASIADRRLIQACPWINIKIGDPVLINGKAFGEYVHTMHHYVGIIIQRIAARFGVDVDRIWRDTERDKQNALPPGLFDID